MYLDPNYRGKGIGRDLLLQTIERAKKSGFKKIKLDTSKKLTQAYTLFKKMGFREVRENFDDERSVFMELNLKEE